MVHNQGTVLAQREVEHKTGEITQFRSLLDSLDLQGRGVTADALHTQRDHVAFLVEDKHAEDVFTVKDNQPKTSAAVQAGVRAGPFPP